MNNRYSQVIITMAAILISLAIALIAREYVNQKAASEEQPAAEQLMMIPAKDEIEIVPIPEIPEEPTPEPEPEPEPAPAQITEDLTIETPEKRYSLTEEERAIVTAVVAAESGYESFEGQCLVAQCILNTCEARNMRPDDVVFEPLQYADPNYELAPLAEEAVAAVFDDGYTVTDEPVRFFYAPKYCDSRWHEEKLTFVIEVGGHRFFKEA